MAALFQDVRHSLRQLRRSPGFTFAAVLTLALGIGVNAAMFTLTYAILLKSLPVPDPGRLIRVTYAKTGMDIGLSGPMYDSLRRHQAAATDLLAWSTNDLRLTTQGSTQKIPGALMSGNGFAVLGLKPFLGRTFSEADDVSGGGRGGYQALLSYDFWNVHFQADPNAVGRTITLDDHVVTIAGVLPKGFRGLDAREVPDVVLPLAFVEVVNPGKEPYRARAGSFWLNVMGRLRPGESLESARSNLQAIRPAVYAEADPSKLYVNGFFKAFELDVASGRSGRSSLRTAYSQPLVLLEVLSGLLLLLCCTNISLLMLARVSERRHEFALRSALGATGGRLLTSVLLEVFLFAVPGLAIGGAIGSALARGLANMLGGIGEPSALNASFNVPVFLFTGSIAILTALAAGLWPALRVRNIAPAVDLKTGAKSTGETAGAWIISVQVAVSVALLVSALLLGNTFARLYLQPSGFHGNKLLFADLDMSATKMKPAEIAQAAQATLRALEHAPGIESAALMSLPPLRGDSSSSRVYSFDRHDVEHSDPQIWAEGVTPSYFETIGTRILAGRALTAADERGEKVCVLSRSAADFYFPGEDAVGRLIYQGDDKLDQNSRDVKRARRVVGIAEDAHFFSLRTPADHVIYTTMGSDYLGFGLFNPVVRAANVDAASDDIRNVLKQILPALPSPVVYTYGDLLRVHLQRERMLISLSSSFAGSAIVLVAIGLFGILMRSVIQRTREIGIRMALGEQRSSIVRIVLASALKRVAIGLVVGCALAYACSRLMRALLYETSPANPWIYAGAAVLLLGVAICAVAVPSHRAASIEPVEALKVE